MGYVKVRGVLANPLKHELRVEVEFIADTGAIYSVIPHSMAEKLKLKVTDKEVQNCQRRDRRVSCFRGVRNCRGEGGHVAGGPGLREDADTFGCNHP